MSDDARYERIRHGVAGVLYARNRVAGELAAMQLDVARLEEAVRAALVAGDESGARELSLRKASRVDAVAGAKRALAEVQREATEATAALVALRESMRSREREQLLARVTELSIQREVEQLGE